MGKSQKKKAIRRHNPVRVPDSHLPQGLVTASATSSKTEAVLPIIHKLQSVDVAERTWACAAVSNLIQNDPSTRRLLQGKNIVGALITRLTDAAEEVVVEAAGALRNLCIDGGYDICAEMYNKNIMAPLRTFPVKISTTLQQLLQNPGESREGACRLVYEFAESIITISWCLSETSNKALRAVNEMRLTPFLMAFLQAREHIPYYTVNAAAQCLYVLTEENDSAISDLRTEPSFITCLLEVTQDQPVTNSISEERNRETRSLTLKVLAAGILRNISPLPTVVPASSIDLENTVIIPLLVPLLSIDLSGVTITVMQILTDLEQIDVIPGNLSLDETSRSDHKTQPQRELEYIEEKLRVVQLSLEILTGICAIIPDPDPISEESAVDSRMDAEGESSDASDVNPVHQKIKHLPVTNTEIVEVGEARIIRSSTSSLLSTLTRPLIALARPTMLSFALSSAEPSPHPPTTSALSTIHIRALECLNNMFLAIEVVPDPPVDSGTRLLTKEMEDIEHVWSELWHALGMVGKVVSDGRICVSRGLERKTEVWEMAVGVMWGIAKLGRGYIVPDAEQMQALMEFCDATADDLTRVKCIGTLECLAQCRQAIDANKVITTFIFNRLSHLGPECVESCLQCAAALIDIYSDESAPCDINFRQGQALDNLVRALPMLRKALRGVDRRKPGGMELRERGDEVLENLAAFIRYRRALDI